MKIVFLCPFLMLTIVVNLSGQSKSENPLAGLVTTTKIMKHTDFSGWNHPVNLDIYTETEKAIQQNINEHITDKIIAYLPSESNEEYSAIDFEPITPYTWKWIELQMVNQDGTVSLASLRRPIWWIKKLQADHVGNQVYLNFPEVGLTGMATVTTIRPNQLDTRLWDEHRNGHYVERPITGKFIHVSNNVYTLYFHQADSMNVTGTHLIWSDNRAGWTPANQLQVGEYVKTYHGPLQVMAVKKLQGPRTVYNLEIYRDHNFHVSLNAILVHNECWNEYWDKVFQAWGKKADEVGGTHGWPIGSTDKGVHRVIVDYERMAKGGMFEVAEKNYGYWENAFMATIDMEEGLAVSQRADKIIFRFMMGEGYKLDYTVLTEVMGNRYNYRAFEENGIKWIEATRTLEVERARSKSTVPPPRSRK